MKRTHSLSPQSRALASYHHGHDRACTHLLLCGPETELPGSISRSPCQYWHSRGDRKILRSYHQPLKRRTQAQNFSSHSHTQKPKNFGLGGGEGACGPQKIHGRSEGSELPLQLVGTLLKTSRTGLLESTSDKTDKTEETAFFYIPASTCRDRASPGSSGEFHFAKHYFVLMQLGMSQRVD